MQSNVSVPDARLQWIFCSEGYFMLDRFIMKELCILCVQTGDYMNWMIEPTDNSWFDLKDSIIASYYYSQYQIHGLVWYADNMQEFEAQNFVNGVVSKASQIFVVDKALKRHLQRCWDYKKVELLLIAPTSTMHSHPDTVCARHDANTLSYCAQRKCHEILTFIMPVLIPFLDTSTFKFEDDAKRIPEKALGPIYGPRRLEEPLYNQLHKLTLSCDGIKNCELSVAGRAGDDGGLGWATDQDDGYT